MYATPKHPFCLPLGGRQAGGQAGGSGETSQACTGEAIPPYRVFILSFAMPSWGQLAQPHPVNKISKKLPYLSIYFFVISASLVQWHCFGTSWHHFMWPKDLFPRSSKTFLASFEDRLGIILEAFGRHFYELERIPPPQTTPPPPLCTRFHLNSRTSSPHLAARLLHSTGQQTNQPTNQSTNQETKQPINQPINQSINQPIGQSISQSTTRRLISNNIASLRGWVSASNRVKASDHGTSPGASESMVFLRRSIQYRLPKGVGSQPQIALQLRLPGLSWRLRINCFPKETHTASPRQ